MHAGNGQLHQFDKSRQLQRRLYLAAKKCRERRFHALYDRIHRPDVLWRAWQEVKTNGGSAGVDGVSLEEVERQECARFVQLSILIFWASSEFRFPDCEVTGSGL